MSRRQLAGRLLVLAVALGVGAVLVHGFVAADAGGHVTDVGQSVAPPRGGTTVVATDSNSWLGREGEGPRASAELFAVGPNGTVTYHDDRHTRYWDVDPVPGTAATVEYVYADHLPPAACGGESVCTRNGIERANLTTDEVTPVFSRVTPGKHSTRWHDADRIDEHHLAVADIARDRVFVVNATSGIVTWSWSVQAAFPTNASGGPFPSDWTHLNDVEVLDDGRIQASLRNHDQVAFLDRRTGLVENWTLGADGDHETLYEQHNPDYIPPERGGPAVLVADSENDRVVEYNRVDGHWVRRWRWTDGRLQWPRDADRLPDGHTLVTDSNGDRVIEVNERGEVVWTLPVAFPYEAERLGTGDESAGGPSATAADLRSRDAGSDAAASSGETGPPGPIDRIVRAADGLTRGPTANAVLYVLPAWMDRLHLAALVVLTVTVLSWAVAEAYWSPWTVTVRRPFDLRRRR